MASGVRRMALVSGGSGTTSGERPGADRARLSQRAAGLLGQALAADDAEHAGLRADEVLADPAAAVSLLGSPEAWPAARHAVVQRYGRVGALLVLGFEDRWRAGAGEEAAAPAGLEELVDRFPHAGAEELEGLLAALDGARGGVPDDTEAARRWLHATYAVAERDGTDTAHRAYMDALDRLLRLAGRPLAS
ncbi:MAG: hypothetical protein KGJ77_08335 [Acidobacteriota bacterium]|nr:hypothetical protein [Acidobacteriota bacterium]